MKDIITDTNALNAYLGFSLKSGLAIKGFDACAIAAKANKVGIVLLSTDASEKTEKNIRMVCENSGVKLKYVNSNIMETVMGNENKKVIAIKNSGLCDKIKTLK